MPTDIQPVPPEPTPPEFPTLADRPAGTYNQKAYAWATYWGGEMMTRLMALVVNVWNNASAAFEYATSAASSASAATAESDLAMGYRNTAGLHAASAGDAAATATIKAAEADASAIAASKLNLGEKSAPPATDNQGDPLLAGATYYDTTLDKWRVWTGAAWGDGISAVAGVASLNGETGALVKTTLAGYGITDALPNTGAIAVNGSVRGNKIAVPALDIDCSKSNYFTKTIAANSTFTFSGVPAAPARYAMIVEVALTGGAITWPAGVIWPNGSAPSLSTGKTHLFFFITADGGTTWRANALTNYAG